MVKSDILVWYGQLQSAPQLVFHLYVMMVRNGQWPWEQAAWTALSAFASMVSLGWGIAAYRDPTQLENYLARFLA